MRLNVLSIILFTVLGFLSLLPESSAQVETKTSVTFKKCYKAELSAIFGGETDACLVFDLHELQGSFEFNLCGGFYIDEKLKVFGIGGGIGTDAKICVNVKTTVKAKSAKEIMKKLEDKGGEGEIYRGKLLDQLKTELKRLPDSTLREMKIDRKQIDQINSLELKSLKDAGKRTDQIKKGLQDSQTLPKPIL